MKRIGGNFSLFGSFVLGGVLKLSIQFHYWQLACSYFVFLPDSDLGVCTFLRICSAQRASRQLAPCGEKLCNCNLFMGHPPGGLVLTIPLLLSSCLPHCGSFFIFFFFNFLFFLNFKIFNSYMCSQT